MYALAGVIWWAGVIGAGMVAHAKGRQWWPYSLLAAFVPIVGFVVAVVMPDRTGGFGRERRTSGWGA